jgi:hypothetical protein
VIVIIAGSRGITDSHIVYQAVKQSGFFIEEIVSGNARGVDYIGEEIAEANEIPLKLFPADWDKHGKSAGWIRNNEMAKYADGLIAVWDGKSKGTKMMIDIATRKGLKVFVYNTEENK